jgi:hypothetical protein
MRNILINEALNHCIRMFLETRFRIIRQLVEFVEMYRRMAVRNAPLLADVGYYEAELAASRRCLQAVATG